jgi:hypothetical protein
LRGHNLRAPVTGFPPAISQHLVHLA